MSKEPVTTMQTNNFNKLLFLHIPQDIFCVKNVIRHLKLVTFSIKKTNNNEFIWYHLRILLIRNPYLFSTNEKAVFVVAYC